MGQANRPVSSRQYELLVDQQSVRSLSLDNPILVVAIFGIQALRKYLKTPAALPAAGGVSLGAKLCRQRQARGMTVESVAQSLGVTPQEVEAWEKDAADPTDQQLMDLAALYGGSLADLFRR